ncbi:SAM-dependent DNA methyltransferase [Candidatus Pacearchaeota archaeon]|nr:SAM-dependent DNA methyltransferase [Candidatus Pacearchaeota archaeon]
MEEVSKGVSLTELEQYLWKAANILRGPIDNADFKAYIFPLLFFKRISDTYDEEYSRALKESDGDEEYAAYPEQHDFQIPDGARWKDIREKSINVGQSLQYAFRSIEKSNPEKLYGIFGDVNWTNKNRLSDELLIDLIEHFSTKNLSKKNVEPDILGQAYEYLIKKFADLTNRKAGEFYTPRAVVHLMGNILKPKEKDSIYDPACGSGGMLLEAFNYVKSKEGDTRTLKLYGQEKNLTTSAIARINLYLHGAEDFSIIRGDTLRNPAFHEGDSLSKFDVVIANPPFSLKNWGSEEWTHDPFGRNIAGTPTDNNGDFAWVQHMITSMAPQSGRMGIVLPHGALFRGGIEGKIRKELLNRDLLETVIGLGPNLFYGTGISACILIFKIKKDSKKKNKVHFIDGSHLFTKGRNQNFFRDEHANQIIEWYEKYKDIENFSKIVELKEIEDNEFNLNISRYIVKLDEEDKITLKEAYSEMIASQKEFEESQKNMIKTLEKYKII